MRNLAQAVLLLLGLWSFLTGRLLQGAALFAILALSGCATVVSTPQQPVPEQFLTECRARERVIATNGDLALAVLDHKEALRLCNSDKQAIREWSDALVKEK
jgi:hypothetical protein